MDDRGALYFDGIDDRAVVVESAALTALEMSTALKVEAWVNPRGDGAGAIVSKEGEYQPSRLTDGTVGFTLASVDPGWSTRGGGVIGAEPMHALPEPRTALACLVGCVLLAALPRRRRTIG